MDRTGNQRYHIFYLDYQRYRPATAGLQSSLKPLRSTASDFLPPIDYRTRGKVTPAKNQGQCGSCWTFSTVAAYESQLLIHEQMEADLSEQFVLDCTTTEGSCGGGIPYYALNNISSTGIPFESSIPYTANEGPTSECSKTKYKMSNPILSINHYDNLTNGELKQFLTDHGPIPVGIHASDVSLSEY